MSAVIQESEIFERLRKLVVNHLNVEIDKVGLESAFVDLGADSLDIVELVMAIEEEFAVEITDNDSESIKTIKDEVKRISPNTFVIYAQQESKLDIT